MSFGNSQSAPKARGPGYCYRVQILQVEFNHANDCRFPRNDSRNSITPPTYSVETLENICLYNKSGK